MGLRMNSALQPTRCHTHQRQKRESLVENFRYLDGWMDTEKDFEIRKALAWAAYHKLVKILNSDINRKIKERPFLATTVESILLYGSETTWLVLHEIRMAYNIWWRCKMTNEQLYAGLSPVSAWLMLAGHCMSSCRIGIKISTIGTIAGTNKHGKSCHLHWCIEKRYWNGLHKGTECGHDGKDVWKQCAALVQEVCLSKYIFERCLVILWL